MTLDNKVAVVTGGSKGIGRAIARRLAADGATLVIASRTEEDLERVADEIEETPVVPVAVDLSTMEGCEQLHQETMAAFDTVDILVNCAGATRSGPFLELSDELWQAGFDLKFFGAVRLSRLF